MKDKNFFKVSHLLEERYGDKLRPSEKYFVIILFKLENRFANKNGWFWHTDKEFLAKNKRNIFGFEAYGFSVSFCKRVRKKLKNLGIIATKYSWYKSGNRAGTFYRLKHKKFSKTQSSK